MTETYGFTHAIITPSTDPADPFVLHIHGLTAGIDGAPDSERTLIATVDDERPMLATRILRMLQARGIAIEGDALAINMSEPDISFLTMRGSLHEDGSEWTDLEVRFVDGEKTAAASFPDAYEDFARAMYDLHGPREPAYRRFAMFRHRRHEAAGGWDDFVEGFDTPEAAKADWRWSTPDRHGDAEVSIVDLSTMTEIESRSLPSLEG